ncbi:MAG: hypothetical protein ACRETL_01675 [Gammaproteobacteria bacterium]
MKMFSQQLLSQAGPIRQQLESWRRTRTHRQRIPAPLWRAMAELAQTHGLSAVSRVFGVNYYDLKRHSGSLMKASPSGPPASAAFVELKMPTSAGVGCVVELEEREAKMTLRLASGNADDALAMIESFWRRRP